jgi:hypothetical protein
MKNTPKNPETPKKEGGMLKHAAFWRFQLYDPYSIWAEGW